jgi:hypothetical protein
MGNLKPNTEFLAIMVDQFHKALKNWLLLKHQIQNDPNPPPFRFPMDKDILQDADYLAKKAFHELCVAAEWNPDLFNYIDRRSDELKSMDKLCFDDYLADIPPENRFKMLHQNEWIPPEDDGYQKLQEVDFEISEIREKLKVYPNSKYLIERIRYLNNYRFELIDRLNEINDSNP